MDSWIGGFTGTDEAPAIVLKNQEIYFAPNYTGTYGSSIWAYMTWGIFSPFSTSTWSMVKATAVGWRLGRNATRGVEQTVAAAATITLDPSNGETIRVTLSATAITTVNGVAGYPGEVLRVEIIQDATGGRSISGWASGTNGFASPEAPTRQQPHRTSATC